MVLQRREIDVRALKKTTALETDTERVIEKPGVFVDENGKVLIIYGRFQDPCYNLNWALSSIEYHTGERTLGLKSISRTFGFRPRLTIRHDFCAPSSLTETHPKQDAVIQDFGKRMSALYQLHAPDVYTRHRELVSQVRPEWMMPGTPFTSGIVNKNNPLKYHHDAGNFPGVMSCMVVLRRDCEGGYLSTPEFNTRFLLEDRSYFLFDGQAILHGVTPIRKLNGGSYRYSVVYYALQQMRHCGNCEEELKRIRAKKRERELRRLLYGEPEGTP